MNEIRFGIRAFKRFDETMFIREYFEFGDKEDKGSEGRLPIFMCGVIDDGIKAAYKKKYNEFRAFVDAHDEKLYEEAKAIYPEPLFIEIPDERKDN